MYIISLSFEGDCIRSEQKKSPCPLWSICIKQFLEVENERIQAHHNYISQTKQIFLSPADEPDVLVGRQPYFPL